MEARGLGTGLDETTDHLHPASAGGTFTKPCCRACNEIKGNMLLPEWHAFMRANPRWWKLWKAPARYKSGAREAAVQEVATLNFGRMEWPSFR